MVFCCLYDNPKNREVAKAMIDNHFKVTNERYVLLTDGKKLHLRKETEKKAALMLNMIEI